MTKSFLVLVAVSLGICLIPSDSDARLLESWPYDKLMKKSDLVVIAKAEKSEDATDRYLAHSWAREFAGQNTTFEVKYVL